MHITKPVQPPIQHTEQPAAWKHNHFCILRIIVTIIFVVVIIFFKLLLYMHNIILLYIKVLLSQKCYCYYYYTKWPSLKATTHGPTVAVDAVGHMAVVPTLLAWKQKKALQYNAFSHRKILHLLVPKPTLLVRVPTLPENKPCIFFRYCTIYRRHYTMWGKKCTILLLQ